MEIMNRRNNSSMKWDYKYIKKRFNIDVDDTSTFYPLFIADMDFKMDGQIKNKLHELVEEPDFGYFFTKEGFFESIIAWYKDVHSLDIHRDWIVPSVGTIASMHLACDMLIEDEDVLIMTPVYGPFLNCSKIGNPITLPLLLKDNQYTIDFENLEKTFQEHNIKVLLFCNPHNPGGKVWDNDELSKLMLLCRQYNVVILSDEIHGDFILTDKKYTSLIEFADIYDQIIISASPNKTFNISGLSTSFILCANKELKERYEAYLSKLHLGCNRLGMDMIEYVYTYGKNWYLDVLNTIKGNVNTIVEAAKEVNCDVMIPEGGFLVWVHLPKITDISSFILDLAKDTHVLLETGARFVDNYDGWVRINAATSPKIVNAAMDLFKNYYKNYK